MANAPTAPQPTTGHTPGEWRFDGRLYAEHDERDQWSADVISDTGRPWVSETEASEEDVHGILLPARAYGRTQEETEANARLIAAAPALLAALRRAVPWLGKMIADGGHLAAVLPADCVAALDQAEAAITDATTPR